MRLGRSIRLVLVASLALAACKRAPEAPDTYALASNAALLPPAPAPSRVVSLAPNLTEYLFALGAGDRVVGVTRFCDWPPEAATRPKVGGFVDLDFETVLGLSPDLVVAVKNSGNRDFVRRLEEVGVRVYWTELTTEDDVFRVARELATLLGRPTDGTALVADLHARIAALEARLAGAPPRRVLVVYGHRPLVVAGGGSFADALIRRAGGVNAAGASRLAYPAWSMEEVVDAAPDVIIDNTMVPGSEEGGLDWARWTSIPAARDGRVYTLGASSTMRPGPRLPEALAELARLVHPERAGGAP